MASLENSYGEFARGSQAEFFGIAEFSLYTSVLIHPFTRIVVYLFRYYIEQMGECGTISILTYLIDVMY